MGFRILGLGCRFWGLGFRGFGLSLGFAVCRLLVTSDEDGKTDRTKQVILNP